MTNRHPQCLTIKTFSRVVLLLSSALLYACGGGGGSDGGLAGGPTPPPPGGGGGGGGAFDGGISGSGQSVGAIQDFGSIIINDDELDTSSSAFDDDGNTSASQDDFKAGQVIAVQADFSNSTASAVVYRSVLKGPIESINIRDPLAGEADIVALGQIIHTNAATNFDNVTLDQLVQNDLVEVSGVRDENGEIVASFIELKQTLVVYKIIGTTSGTTASTFNIGTLSVDFSNAVLKDFPGNGAPTDGQRVEVKADPADFTAPTSLSASEVEFIPELAATADDRLELEGFIDRFASATDFDVAGFPVTTSTTATLFVNGDVSSLGLGVKIEVEGGVNAGGVLEAVKVVIKSTGAIRVEAQIADNADIDTTANTIQVLGVTFKVRAITRFEDKSSQNAGTLALADLVAGERVEIRGFLDGETVVATRIEREDSRARARLRGPITAEDATAGTVTILNVTVTGVAGTTVYRPEDETMTITQSEFHDLVGIGSFVKADWDNFTATTETVNELSIEN